MNAAPTRKATDRNATIARTMRPVRRGRAGAGGPGGAGTDGPGPGGEPSPATSPTSPAGIDAAGPGGGAVGPEASSSDAAPRFTAAPWASGSVGVTIRDGVIPFLLCVLVLCACASVVMAEVMSNAPEQTATGAPEPDTAPGDRAADQRRQAGNPDDPPVAPTPSGDVPVAADGSRHDATTEGSEPSLVRLAAVQTGIVTRRVAARAAQATRNVARRTAPVVSDAGRHAATTG